MLLAPDLASINKCELKSEKYIDFRFCDVWWQILESKPIAQLRFFFECTK